MAQYIRVSKDLGRPVELFPIRSVEQVGDLRLVDINLRADTDIDLIWEAIHEIPDRFAGAPTVVFRWPSILKSDDEGILSAFLETAAERKAALGEVSRVEVFAHVVGSEPIHLTSDGSSPTPHALLRQLEFESLLEVHEAHLSGADYHYRLPSGSHAAEFLRVANALRHPRDVWVVAAWMTDFLTAGCGLLLDTASLTPLAVQLDAFAAGAGFALGDIGVMDSYPASLPAVSTVVEAASSTARCLAVLSVDSTGSTRRLLEPELEARNPGNWRMHTLVRFGVHDGDPNPNNEVWTHDQAVTPSAPEDCTLCRDHRRAFLVTVDERTYYPVPNIEPEKIVPSIAEGDNAAFWELANAQNAVLLEVTPSASAMEQRAERTPLAVRIRFDALVADVDRLIGAVRIRLQALEAVGPGAGSLSVSKEHLDRLRTHMAATSVVFVENDDLSNPISLHAVLQELGLETARIVVGKKQLRDEAVAGDSILCFAWGSLTGSKMKRMRVAATDAYGGSAAEINGFCLHARPPTLAEWRSAVLSFRPSKLGALWLSFLPWGSPLAEERRLLERMGMTSPIVERRLRYLSDTDPDSSGHAMAALLGVDERCLGQSKVRDTSIYGHQISTDTAFAALGAALQRARDAASHSARRIVVNLAGIGRPYFDANLIASMLRWTRPAEAYWGGDAAEQRETLNLLWEAGGNTDEELTVIIPELFLAAALGKMPAASVIHLFDRYSGFLAGGGWSDGSDLSAERRGLADDMAAITSRSLGLAL